MSSAQAAYRLRRRWLTLLSVTVVAAVGLLFLVVGLTARASGEYVAWPVPVAGLLAVLLALVAFLLTSRPRRPGPAVAVPDGVALPLRPGYAALLAAGPVLGGLLVATVTSLDDRGWVRVLGVVALVVLAAGGWWLARSAARARLVVTPRGLRLPHRSQGQQEWTWTELAGVELVHGFVPFLLVVPRGDRDAPGFTRLYPQGWSFESIEALVDHYAGDRRARAQALTPEAVDRFRG